jgi:hypothetical protein
MLLQGSTSIQFYKKRKITAINNIKYSGSTTYPAVKRSKHEADNSQPYGMVNYENVKLYIHSPKKFSLSTRKITSPDPLIM